MCAKIINKEKDINFYINEIEVESWLTNDEDQFISFVDRVEYRHKNKLHRLNGPAIVFHNNIGDQYYIDGEKLSKDEWDNFNRTRLIDNLMN